MDAVFGNNARGRVGLALALYLVVLACMGGVYLGQRLLEPLNRATARADRFWVRGIPVAEVMALPPPARRRALESLTQELTALGQASAMANAKVATQCLAEEPVDNAACRQLEILARAQHQTFINKGASNLNFALGVLGGTSILVLVCGVFLFRLLGRAGRSVLALSLLGYFSYQAMEMSA